MSAMQSFIFGTLPTEYEFFYHVMALLLLLWLMDVVRSMFIGSRK